MLSGGAGGISISIDWTTWEGPGSCIENEIVLVGAVGGSSDDQGKRTTPSKIGSLGGLATATCHDDLKANF
jgi:hypothetical protein